MGKLRARTEQELEARRQEILDAAASQLMREGYEAVTLATIATQTSISRTSMYTYYQKKEDIFVDLMIREYRGVEQALDRDFWEPLSRRAFCEALTELFLQRQVLLKLLSLQLTVRDHQYSDAMMQRFVAQTQPYAAALRRVLRRQFPRAEEAALERFMVQLSFYACSLYAALHMPPSLAQAMEAAQYYGPIPEGRALCLEGLWLLTAPLQEESTL